MAPVYGGPPSSAGGSGRNDNSSSGGSHSRHRSRHYPQQQQQQQQRHPQQNMSTTAYSKQTQQHSSSMSTGSSTGSNSQRQKQIRKPQHHEDLLGRTWKQLASVVVGATQKAEKAAANYPNKATLKVRKNQNKKEVKVKTNNEFLADTSFGCVFCYCHSSANVQYTDLYENIPNKYIINNRNWTTASSHSFEPERIGCV